MAQLARVPSGARDTPRHRREPLDHRGRRVADMVAQQLAFDPAADYKMEETDVVYRRDGATEWLARIYRPSGVGPFPALLDVHGGAWNTGTREQNAPIDRALAACGMVVAAIDFRLAPAHPYPA